MRYSPIYETWVAVAERRQARPMDYAGPKDCAHAEKVRPKTLCPFCEGHEMETPSEVDAVSRLSESERTLDNYRRPNAPGWLVRAVPNRYPFLEADGEMTVQKFGPFLSAPNVGLQEVMVDVPYHGASLEDLSPEEFQYFIHFYHRRLHQLRKKHRWKYVQIFKNQGPKAGASLKHLHSQIAALPFVPPSVAQEQKFLADFRAKNQLCWHCEVLKYELAEQWRAVEETRYFGVFCPFASRYPGEIWLLPKRHVPCFVQSEREELDDLAEVLRRTIQRLAGNLGVRDFNLVLRTSPWEYTTDGALVDENFHWRLEICPRTVIQAGFELGTGCFVNPLAPENAAAALKKEGERGQL